VFLECLEDRRLLSLSLFPISTVTVPAGTAVCVALNGTDPGQTVSFSATGTNYSLLTPVVMPQSNKSVQINAEVGGVSQSMTFQLFDNLFPLNGSNPNATLSAIESLFSNHTYDGKSFYRVADSNSGPFAVQGGVSPTNSEPTFNDQFDPNLQFTSASTDANTVNSGGVLAMANYGPDTNTTEFFITTQACRYLDYNYTIFGFQTTGQTVRQQIAALPVTGSYDLLDTPVTINSASIFADTQNGVLMLRAAPGTTGQLTVTVTASDGTNSPVQQTFTVNVVADTGLVTADPWASVVPPAPTVTFANGQTSLATTANNSSPQKGITFNLANLIPGDLATVYANGNPIYSTFPAGSTVTVTTDGTKTLADGSYDITAIQTLLNKTVMLGARSEKANVPSLDSQPATLTVSTAPPQISSVAPTTATVDQQYTYQVLASSAATPLSYSLVTSPANMSISDTGLVTWTPNSSQVGPQAVDIRVTDQAGQTSDQTFTITTAAPATQFLVSAPASATAGKAFAFTVTAEDQNDNPATSYAGTVHFTSSDPAAVLPPDTTLTNGVGTFSATLMTGGSQTLTATDTVNSSIAGTSGAVNVAATPVVMGISPSAGPLAGGVSVTISGANLAGATAVMFGKAAAKFAITTATQIVATSPAGKAGTVDVTVVTAKGTSTTSALDQFTYVAAPTVTKISLAAGPTAGGTRVAISGANLAGATAVYFGKAKVTAALGSTPAGQIVATSPAGTAGIVDVTVVTAGGTSKVTAADNFTYVALPAVTKLAPAAGPAAGGTLVTISGTNLAGGTVLFGTQQAKLKSVKAKQIVAVSPAFLAGTVDVTVTTAGGRSSYIAADRFTYTGAPAVSGLAPPSGGLKGGAVVTISGTNLAGATAVRFGKVLAKIQSTAATRIVVVSPAGNAGTVDVTVVTPDGTSPVNRPADRFSYMTGYTVEKITDAAGDIEYQMLENGFQFGTLLQTPPGAVGFRGHPDQSDINGWGTTVQENVYIAGAGVDATGGAVISAVAGRNGIRVSAGGDVPSPLGTAGTWSWSSTISYDPAQQKITLAGSTAVTLGTLLSGDMNVGRDDSNYLYDYPLNGGGVGPTGDMKSVSFIYGPDQPVREDQWTPLPGLEGTSPQDSSDDVTTTVWGQVNKSDPNQAAVAKPTVEREIISTDPATRLIVGCNWDSTQVGYQYDNIGVEQIVRPQNTSATSFEFQNAETWTLPDTSNPTVTATAQVAATNEPVLTGTANPSSPSDGIARVIVVVVGADTRQTLTATVNGTSWSAAVPVALPGGTYNVQATATDEAGNTAFATGTLTVTTKTTPAFSNLSAPTIAAGTASTTLSGTISLVPAGESVMIILDGVTQFAAVDSSGNFSSSFDTRALPVADSPYTISYVYEGDADLNRVDTIQTLTVFATGPNIVTVAGTLGSTNAGYSGDGGAATAAKLNTPFSVAVDSAGDIFIADTKNNVIREVDHLTGDISTVVGGGSNNDPQFKGPASGAAGVELSFPNSIVLDSAGNLYIADNGANVIRKVVGLGTANATISTVAGTGTGAYGGDGGAATAAYLNNPAGVAVDSFGDIFIADTANNVIREVNTSGVISTVAGTGTEGNSGNGGLATAATLNEPQSIAVDPFGDIFIADTSNNVIREVVRATGDISAVAGGGCSTAASYSGSPLFVQLSFPLAVALDAAGNLYVADTNNNVVRKITAVGTVNAMISTIAGDGTGGATGDGGPATAAELSSPVDVAVNAAGQVFIADAGNNAIRRVG
jgi:cyclophilin family peptidyl-prolyl cis-trans isomerase